MIQIKDFMIKDVITIDSKDSVYNAISTMADNTVSCLVVMEQKKPVGLITERSIVRNVLLLGKNLKKVAVKKAMHEIHSCAPSTDYFELVEFMRKNSLRRVAIVKSGKLLGIVTETDVVRTSVKLRESLKETKKDRKSIEKKLATIQKGIRKMDSGYPRLNEMLRGGFPYNKSCILVGPPGSGKGLIAFNFMRQGLESGDKVVYICANEFIDDIKEVFLSLGTNIDEYVKSEDFKVINMYGSVETDGSRIFSEEEELVVKDYDMIKGQLCKTFKSSGTNVRVVVNVISQSLVLHSARTVYKFLVMINNLLKSEGATTLYFMHKGDESSSIITNVEEIMDGIMEFDSCGKGLRSYKRLTVKKMKPEFAVLPLEFKYDFDRRKTLTIKKISS